MSEIKMRKGDVARLTRHHGKYVAGTTVTIERWDAQEGHAWVWLPGNTGMVVPMSDLQYVGDIRADGTVENHEFDAERARNGEPVQFSRGSMDGKIPQEWVDVHYVGPDRVRGGHIVQFDDGVTISTHALRMKPRKMVRYVNLWEDGRPGGSNARHFDSEQEAQANAVSRADCRLIAAAVPVEVEVLP